MRCVDLSSVQEVAIAIAAVRLCVVGSDTDSDESAFGFDLDEDNI